MAKLFTTAEFIKEGTEFFVNYTDKKKENVLLKCKAKRNILRYDTGWLGCYNWHLTNVIVETDLGTMNIVIGRELTQNTSLCKWLSVTAFGHNSEFDFSGVDIYKTVDDYAKGFKMQPQVINLQEFTLDSCGFYVDRDWMFKKDGVRYYFWWILGSSVHKGYKDRRHFIISLEDKLLIPCNNDGTRFLNDIDDIDGWYPNEQAARNAMRGTVKIIGGEPKKEEPKKEPDIKERLQDFANKYGASLDELKDIINQM